MNDRQAEKSCHSHTASPHTPQRPDWLLWGSLLTVATLYVAHFLLQPAGAVSTAASTAFEMVNAVWWGVALGILFVGALGRVPRELVMALLGSGKGAYGILRAAAAGVLLDLCSHGILMVGMKLYERGATLGQTMAFLIASPWNSFSLTLILFGLIGVNWTLLFIFLSLVIAFLTGIIVNHLVERKTLPANPHTTVLPPDFNFMREARQHWQTIHWTPALVGRILWEGLLGSRMVLRWILFGIVLAAAIRALMPADMFQNLFGPSLLGLGMTIVAATVIEVCSEGSTPLAADLLNRARAPGNSFAFLMGGVSTDYTEIMSLKDTTGSWKIALYLPLITLPQIILLAFLINHF